MTSEKADELMPRDVAIEAVAKIEMDREGSPYSRTQEEFYSDAAEVVDVVLAAIERHAREEVSGEELKFAETVLDELQERALAYSHHSIERHHFNRSILAISGLLRAAMNPKPAEAEGGVGHDRNLEILVSDLRPYADRTVGNLRIDMADVKSILAMYDAATPTTEKDGN